MSDLPSWARPGMKVVCIDASDIFFVGIDRLPLIEGAIYTIEAVSSCCVGYGLALIETPNEMGPLGNRYGYNIERFRPLVTEQDDLETHFYQYLKTDHRATQKTEERA